MKLALIYTQDGKRYHYGTPHPLALGMDRWAAFCGAETDNPWRWRPYIPERMPRPVGRNRTICPQCVAAVAELSAFAASVNCTTAAPHISSQATVTS